MANLELHKETEKSRLRGELLGFLLQGVPDKAYTWVFREIQQAFPDFLTPSESAAIAGHFAVSQSSYKAALQAFQLVLDQDRSLFFQYPALIGDLGQSFQYTDAHGQGIPLFLEWDRLLQTGGADKDVMKDMVPHIRYRLLHFAGRMERRRGNYAKGIEYFQAALPLAPDPIQEDACIWYILHTTWLHKPQNLIPLVYTYLSRWHDPSYFADILDLLCCYLTANRQWKGMLETFSRIRFKADGATIAKYAYMLGRAVSEGYIPVTDGLSALKAVAMGEFLPKETRKTTLAQTFFRIALEEKKASFYYRGLSAAHLGDKNLPFSVDPQSTNHKDTKKRKIQDFPHPDQMELLLGFFEFGAASYAIPYIKNLQDTLSIPELRFLAETLGDHEQWIESIRLISIYMERDDYELSLEDLKLYYPQPFKDTIEENAREARIPVEILYGLIRTESAFDPNIRSHAGAIGLSQVMPKTAEEEANRIRKRGGPDYLENPPIDLRNPAVNVHIGASYLSYLISLTKSPMQALLSYNGGYSRVRRWRTAAMDLPEDLFLETIELTETREYGKRVLAAALAYGYLYFDLSIEAVVADIFKQYQDP
jgi:soluble lytic murein transglycosylase